MFGTAGYASRWCVELVDDPLRHGTPFAAVGVKVCNRGGLCPMWVKLCALLLVALATGCQSAVPAAGPTPAPTAAVQRAVLTSRIVAVGIPGASAVSPVGQFHA